MTWKLNPKIPTRGAAAVTHDFLMWELCQFLTLTSSASFGSFGSVRCERAVTGQQGSLTPFCLDILGVQASSAANIAAGVYLNRPVYPHQLHWWCSAPASDLPRQGTRNGKWKRESATKVFCCLLCESDLCEEHWNQAAQAGRAVTSRLVCKTATAHWFGDRGLCEPRGRSWRWSRSPNKHVHRTCTAPVAKEIFTLWNWLTYLCTAEPGLKRSSAQRGLDWQFGAEWQKAPCVTRRPEVWSNNQTSMTSSVEF